MLNLCFGAPKRLSVDLDYNYILHLDREKMLADRPRVEEALVQLAQRLGYGIQKSADAFASRKYFLKYRSSFAQEERMEVDLNYLFRLPIAGMQECRLWQPGDLDQPSVRIVSPAEILIGKVLALFDRGALRDVWDVANLPYSMEGILLEPLFRSRFIALSAILSQPISSYTRSRLEKLANPRSVSEQLAPLLIAGSAPQRAELIERAWVVVGRFTVPELNEETYLDGIAKGELRMESLFPDHLEEARRLAAHPAILWKLDNIQKQLAAKGRKKHS